MSDDDQDSLLSPTDEGHVPAVGRGPARGRHRPKRGARGRRVEVIATVIAVLLAIGVVITALDMKFQADQARWQQRQTCLEWYRLQADYGLGPWYEKLPAAAADCGGGEADDGTPLVPGGSAPAIVESEIPDTGETTTTTIAPAPTFPSTSIDESGP